jgi:hypothetical protein
MAKSLAQSSYANAKGLLDMIREIGETAVDVVAFLRLAGPGRMAQADHHLGAVAAAGPDAIPVETGWAFILLSLA